MVDAQQAGDVVSPRDLGVAFWAAKQEMANGAKAPGPMAGAIRACQAAGWTLVSPCTMEVPGLQSPLDMRLGSPKMLQLLFEEAHRKGDAGLCQELPEQSQGVCRRVGARHLHCGRQEHLEFEMQSYAS